MPGNTATNAYTAPLPDNIDISSRQDTAQSANALISRENHAIDTPRTVGTESAQDPLQGLLAAKRPNETFMKNVYFFATRNDIVRVLTRLESKIAIQYVETATRRTAERATFLSAVDIPDLGLASHETGAASAGYLVSLRDVASVPRALTTGAGERHWCLYNGDNPGSMVLTPAGSWKDMLLAGNVGTVHDDPVAKSLVRRFQSALKEERFAKGGRFWVGKEALDMLHSGCRLSMTAEQSPPDFDLRPEHVAGPPDH